MRRLFLAIAAAGATTALFASRHIGFETDAFNRSYPVTYARDFVFSPASFEVDCAVVAESLKTIPKASVSERLGVVLDFESTYRPVLDFLADRTNGLDIVSARGFCVPDAQTMRPDHCGFLERVYGVEVMPKALRRGAERWFRATMEGDMESFSLPREEDSPHRYSYYDLVSIRASWLEPFPVGNTRRLSFYTGEGTNSVPVVCMSDVRVADTYETEDFTLLRLPLRGDAWFYAMLPKKGADWRTLRAYFSSARVDTILTIMKSVTDPSVAHGPCAIVLPRIDLRSRTMLSPVFDYFRIPTQGLDPVAGAAPPQDLVQEVHFRLFENGPDEKPLEKKPPESVVPLTRDVKRLVFNRPFLFFIYHEQSETIPVVGQFRRN